MCARPDGDTLNDFLRDVAATGTYVGKLVLATLLGLLGLALVVLACYVIVLRLR